MRRAVLAALAFLAPAAAAAQTLPAPGDDVIVTLGLGPKVQPEYEGAKSYMLSPFPIVGLRFMVNPFTGQPASEYGLGFAPAFRFLGERDKSVDKRLAGLNSVDMAFEAGVTVDYTVPFARAFVEVRQGFGGHQGQVVDLGAEGIFRPAPGLKISVGPRLSFASDDYMSTYFGVTKKEAGKSKFSAFDADGGFRSWGAAARADYEWSPNWLLRADASWNRLAGDAGRSPIVRKGGSADQFTFGIGVAYRFGVDYR